MTEVEKADILLEVFSDSSHLCDENLLLLRNDFLWKWRTKGKGKGFFIKGTQNSALSDAASTQLFSDFEEVWAATGFTYKPPSCHEQHCLRVVAEGFGGDRWRGGRSASIRANIGKFRSSVSAHSKSKTVLLTDDVSVAEFIGSWRKEEIKRKEELAAKLTKAVDNHYDVVPKNKLSRMQNQIDDLRSQVADRQLKLNYTAVSKEERIARENAEADGQSREYISILQCRNKQLSEKLEETTIKPWNASLDRKLDYHSVLHHARRGCLAWWLWQLRC